MVPYCKAARARSTSPRSAFDHVPRLVDGERRRIDEAGRQRDHVGVLDGLLHQKADGLPGGPVPAAAEADGWGRCLADVVDMGLKEWLVTSGQWLVKTIWLVIVLPGHWPLATSHSLSLSS